MDEKLQNAYDALQAAHDAGNTEDATQLADYIETLKAQQKSAAQPEATRTSAVLPAMGGALGTAAGTGTFAAAKGVDLIRALDRLGKNQPVSTKYNPRGSSVEESVQNWRTYTDAQNEAAKSVRRDAELHKKYPGFTRPNLPHLQPTVPTATENLLGHAANLGTAKPITGMTVGANAIDLAQQIKAGNPLQSVVSTAGLAGAAAPYVKAIPAKYRGIGTAVSLAAPIVNRALDQFTNPPEEHADGHLVGKALKHVPGAALIGGLAYPEVAEAYEQLHQGKIGEGIGSLLSTVAGFIPSGALGALIMGLTPSELGDSSLYKSPGEYHEGDTDILKGSYLPPKRYAPGGKVLKKFTEAIIPHEGKTLLATLADRTKATGGFSGGPGFINLHPDYTWAVDAPGVVTKHMNVVNRFGGPDQTVFAPMLMSTEAHKSNRPVFHQIYNDLQEKIKSGEFTPEQIEKLNQRILSEKGVDLSKSPGVESPDFLKFADTFNRRGKVADILGLKKTGGVDLQKHLESTIDPALKEAETGAIGPQIFTMEGSIEKPEIHPAYSHLFLGEKGADQFTPVPREFLFRDLEKQAMEQMGRPMTDYNYRNVQNLQGGLPNQLIDDKLIKSLQDLGYKKGGKIKKKK